VVGEGFPEEFAEGPAMGRSVAAMKKRAYFDSGTRKPMVDWPGWTLVANGESVGTGMRMVRGPGQ